MESESVLLANRELMPLLVLFLAGTFGSKLAERLQLPDVVVFLVFGIALGPSVLSLVHIPADSLMNQLILLFGACFILFHGGIMTGFGTLRTVWRTVTLLSTLGVVVTAFVVAGAAMLLFGIAFLPALLLGSIIASTDPAALVPIFQKFPIRRKVSETVITESAFTDATGAIMTTVVLGIWSGGSGGGIFPITGQFLLLAVGGIAVGAVIGWIAAFLLSENDRGLLRKFPPMVTVLTVLSAYLLAEAIHASGFMSAFVAGLMLGNARSFRLTILPNEEHHAHLFIDAISLKMRMLIFLLVGSQVDFTVLREYGGWGLAVVAVFIAVARPLTVLVSLLPDRKAGWTRRETLFFFWTRETGVIAAALAGIVSGMGMVEGKLISAVVFLAILVTLLVQASTTPYLARKLGLLEPSRQPVAKKGIVVGD